MGHPLPRAGCTPLAAPAGLIALDILRDGAVAELLDGAPRRLDPAGIHPLVPRLADELERRYPGHSVPVRETGRCGRAKLVPQAAPAMAVEQAQALLPGRGCGAADRGGAAGAGPASGGGPRSRQRRRRREGR